MFLQKSIETLQNDRSASAALKASCDEVIRTVAQFQQDGKVDCVALPDVNSAGWSVQQQLVLLRPFELACQQSKSVRLVTSALDSIQKLVAYGHIRHIDDEG